jgi:hypothetical protein
MLDQPGYDDWVAFAIGEHMNRINCYGFYSLGKWMNKVESLTADSTELDMAMSAVRADGLLNSLLRVGPVKLKGATQASSEVFKGLKYLIDFLEKRDEREGVRVMQVDLTLMGLRKSIETLETIMSSELALAPTYSVPNRGVFSTDSLLDSADDVFEDARDKVSEEARADTRQAGRCLAFDLPTAAGFHIARATESVIKQTMNAFGCPPPKESQRNWGFYIKALEERGLKKEIVHHLSQLKDLHRNPLIHPEVTLTPSEAQQLWSLCTSAMIVLIAEIVSRGPDDGI